MKRRKYGFSLIELLVVIAIITLLMALILPALLRAREHEKLMQATKEVRDLATAAVNYYQDFGAYPPDTGTFATGSAPDTVIDPDSIYKYLSLRRKDPATGAIGGPYYLGFNASRLKGPAGMTYVDIWGNPYQLDAFHMSAGQKIGEPYPGGGDPTRKVADIKIWSFGPDGKDSTGSNQFEGKGTQPEDRDNIDSWTE